MTLFALAEEARAESLPFICKERPRNLFKATPGTSFMLVTALVPERTKGCVSGSHGVKPRGFESHPMYNAFVLNVQYLLTYFMFFDSKIFDMYLLRVLGVLSVNLR